MTVPQVAQLFLKVSGLGVGVESFTQPCCFPYEHALRLAGWRTTGTQCRAHALSCLNKSQPWPAEAQADTM